MHKHLCRSNGYRMAAAILAGAMLLTTGCETKDFINPSNTDRIEGTPITLPILRSIDLVDEPSPALVGLSSVQAEDLFPEVREYVIGASDILLVTIFELRFVGVDDQQVREVSEVGYISLPGGIGKVKAAGRTASQLEKDVAALLEQKEILKDPQVTVIAQTKTQNRFSLIGEPRQGGANFGTYPIPRPDFRLLDAIAMARGIPGRTRTLHIYRTVPLTGAAAGEEVNEPADGVELPDEAGKKPEDLIDDLDKLLEEEQGGTGGLKPPSPDAGKSAPPALERSMDAADAPPRWVFVGGKWVKIQRPVDARPTGIADFDTSELITQRIIEVPYYELINGDMRYNIVVRPGDVIKVPAINSGNFYMSGQISRPGTYILSGENELTVKMAVASAGGLNGLAVPERVDLIRRIGDDREVFLRLNYRKIAEGTQPDMFLKPNDQLNFGTNIFAIPIAVVRNGFRMSYGFGFVLDRNFNTDVFSTN